MTSARQRIEAARKPSSAALADPDTVQHDLKTVYLACQTWGKNLPLREVVRRITKSEV